MFGATTMITKPFIGRDILIMVGEYGDGFIGPTYGVTYAIGVAYDFTYARYGAWGNVIIGTRDTYGDDGIAIIYGLGQGVTRFFNGISVRNFGTLFGIFFKGLWRGEHGRCFVVGVGAYEEGASDVGSQRVLYNEFRYEWGSIVLVLQINVWFQRPGGLFTMGTFAIGGDACLAITSTNIGASATAIGVASGQYYAFVVGKYVFCQAPCGLGFLFVGTYRGVVVRDTNAILNMYLFGAFGGRLETYSCGLVATSRPRG